jgi:hypothetical protein
MAAREVEIRNQVATELQAQLGSFSIVFTVAAGGPEYEDVNQRTQPRVFITCLNTESNFVTRETKMEVYKLGVTVTDYLQKSTQAEIDDMLLLVEEIRDFLTGRLYPQGWHFTTNDGTPVDSYDIQVHETNNVFVSYLEFECQNHVLLAGVT